MKYSFLVFCAFLIVCGNPNAGLSTPPAPSPLWPLAVQANTDRLIENGLSRQEIMTVTEAMVQARFQEQQIISLQNAVMQAYSQGLPTAPLNDKILEGIAKHAAPPSIVLAMERVASRYARALQLASQLSGKQSQKGQWQSLIATGNAAGLSFADLERILQKVQARAGSADTVFFNALTTETLTTARDMARQSLSTEQVAEIICLAIEKGFNAGNMRELNSIFSSRAMGTPLNNLAADCLSGLHNGSSPSETLHNLNPETRRGEPSTRGREDATSGPAKGSANDTTGSDNGNSGSSVGGSSDTGAGNSGNGGGNGSGGSSGNGNGSGGNGGGSGGGNGKGQAAW